MSIDRISLTSIRVESDLRPPAELSFRQGLNVVTGPSDTGKTYACGLIDYMLGASEPPQDNQYSSEYKRALIGITGRDNAAWTIWRQFTDNAAKLFEVPLHRMSPDVSGKNISAVHRTGSKDSLSYFLLSQIGLTDRQIKKTKGGDRASLTFRHVAHLAIIGEERIISKKSPALTEQYVKDTEERSVFNFFLTGQDESSLGPKGPSKKERTNLVAEKAVLESLLTERRKKLGALITPETDISAQLEKLDEIIRESTNFVAATQDEVAALENQRSDLWGGMQKARSQRLYLNEQFKRLELLKQFYDSDGARLQTIHAAGEAFRSIKDGSCAVCGSQEGEPSVDVEKFQAGCLAELKKLHVLQRELVRGMADLAADRDTLTTKLADFDGAISRINQDLQHRLKAQSERGRSSLGEVMTARERLLAAKQLEDEIGELEARVKAIAELVKVKKPSPAPIVASPRLDLEFCELLRATLERWRFPTGGGVTFDLDKFDVVLGEQYRGSYGKGYRALTHAAFTISLMRHCRAHGIPHPGFVLLDTPLNPLREPDKDGRVFSDEGMETSNEMKDAFFEDLANDQSGDQFIVFENSEPPASLRPRMHYIHFTKNPQFGRYGFFPL